MTSSKSTKRALLTSVLALLMCVTMLVGATFAWFTDTASTGVNKIQAGNLDVKLEYATAWNEDGSVKTWADAEGKTLPFLVNGKIPAEGTQNPVGAGLYIHAAGAENCQQRQFGAEV